MSWTGTPGRRRVPRLSLLCAVVVLALAGCQPKPRAPVLRDGPVYQNNREGFFFLVPDGWTQTARSELPPGKLDRERLLVSYVSSGKAVEFEVSLADLPPTVDLASYLEGPGFGVTQWKPLKAPEAVEIGGRPATRYVFAGQSAREKMTKEVVVFRKDDRAYFFTGVYLASGDKARGQIGRAVASISWK